MSYFSLLPASELLRLARRYEPGLPIRTDSTRLSEIDWRRGVLGEVEPEFRSWVVELVVSWSEIQGWT
jgi:hypothetical protein